MSKSLGNTISLREDDEGGVEQAAHRRHRSGARAAHRRRRSRQVQRVHPAQVLHHGGRARPRSARAAPRLASAASSARNGCSKGSRPISIAFAPGASSFWPSPMPSTRSWPTAPGAPARWRRKPWPSCAIAWASSVCLAVGLDHAPVDCRPRARHHPGCLFQPRASRQSRGRGPRVHCSGAQRGSRLGVPASGPGNTRPHRGHVVVEPSSRWAAHRPARGFFLGGLGAAGMGARRHPHGPARPRARRGRGLLGRGRSDTRFPLCTRERSGRSSYREVES